MGAPAAAGRHDDRVTLSVDFSAIPSSQRAAEIGRLCDAMEAADKAGRYSRLTVERPWSAANPVLEGDFAAPGAIRWYLERELGRLAAAGARITVSAGREALDLRDPALATAVDETRSDLRRKKLFLFEPERMALSIDRLQHYTGTAAEQFQRYVLLTNYSWHVEEFRAALPEATGPDAVNDLDAAEARLLLQVLEYPTVVAYAAEQRNPSVLVRHMFDLSNLYNSYNAKARVITDEGVINSRLVTTAAVEQALRNGLTLCNVDCPDYI